MEFSKSILVTGGAGFIGSHAVRRFVTRYPEYRIINLDKLTYAGNLDNVKDLEGKANYQFVYGDICDEKLIEELFAKYQIDSVLHLAAESHVDRSIENPLEFINTNIIGTLTLLNVARKHWGEGSQDRQNLFYHISTDEVYGSLGKEGYFTESTSYDPRSPYSASKASSDHLVKAYFHTYKLPVVLSNCSNNYGPNQYPEKLIPVVIKQIFENRPIPVYGTGDNIRDWLYVLDHVEAMDIIFHQGKLGETYNIGGNNEWNNLDLVHKICSLLDHRLGKEQGECAKLISFVTDRKGHDKRYAIDASKLKNELGWEARQQFDKDLGDTIDWYLELYKSNKA